MKLEPRPAVPEGAVCYMPCSMHTAYALQICISPECLMTRRSRGLNRYSAVICSPECVYALVQHRAMQGKRVANHASRDTPVVTRLA